LVAPMSSVCPGGRFPLVDFVPKKRYNFGI
jgi:hypothetical protein